MRQRLKERRRSAGYTQQDIATKLKCTEQYYNLIENGHRRPSPEKAQQLGKILSFDWTEFYKEE